MNSGLRSTPLPERQRSNGFSLLEVMVALAILGVTVVALFQLFSMALRSTKKAEDYSKALFYARSMLDEAYSNPEIENGSDSSYFENDYYKGTKQVSVRSESEDGKTKLYEITVTVTWPPSGSLKISGLRTVYETNE